MAGGSRPTQADVARLAGVSRQTVSLVVLNDPRVSPHSRATVMAAMAQLDYRPNIAARALVSHHTGFLGIVFSDLANPFHAELAEALRAAAERLGFVPFISPVGQSAEEEKVAINRFTEMAVDGLILVSPLATNHDLEEISERVPTVIVTRDSAPKTADLVHADDRSSARLVTEELLAAGYDPVVFLGVERRTPGDSSLARIAGYRQAMDHAARQARVEIVAQGAVSHIVAGLAAALDRGFGLLCHNDLIALEAWAALSELGLQPGPEVGVAGFDDTSMARFPGVGLTSVNNDTTGFADTAIEMISQRLAGRTGQRDVTLPTRVVVRRSTTRG